MKNKCKNCGADNGLHHYETNQCPAGGYEAPIGKVQVWMTTTFQEEDNFQEQIDELKKEIKRLEKLIYSRTDTE